MSEATEPKLTCPSCKSNDIKDVKKTKHNGVYGPGSHSIVIDQYYSCQNCGTRFDKVDKK